MFCINQEGFSLADDVTLTTFKPFFVDLTLPYSVVRGESFTLKATVFNYLTRCMKVKVTLAQSTDFQVQECTQCVYSSCLCGEQSITFYWNVTATTLGQINFTVSTEALDTAELCGTENTVVPPKGASDTLIKPLLIKPEGILLELTHTSFLCPKGNTLVDIVELVLPGNLVPDSARAVFAVQGDLMGNALQNVDQLIRIPSGCGEQNMLVESCLIYVVSYLQNTNQLTPEINARALGFMVEGYVGELNYKRSDGSYSAFGNNDPEGSTWLTAFVLKCFSLASRYIFIDQTIQGQGLAWLASHQLPNGCFESVGRIIHTDLKGGVDDNVSLSAYIVSALLEMGIPDNDTMVAMGLEYLREAASNVTSLYSQALLAYTFTLSKDEALRAELLSNLESKANITDGLKFWSYLPQPASGESFWAQPQAADVELTAYVVLVYLSEEHVTEEAIGYVLPAVRWLTRQQNAYGGFASTQDTVVALQALTKFAEVTFSSNGNVEVTVKSTESIVKSFLIQQNNRLLVQSVPLPEIPGTYRVSADGSGCIFAQTTLRVNVFPVQNYASFNLAVGTDWSCEPGPNSSNLNIIIVARYTGSRTATNMVLIEVNMLSGFIPGPNAVTALMTQPLVKKVEINNNAVNIYLEQVPREPQALSVVCEQDVVVADLKPAMVTIYDYYKPDERAVADYNICQ